MSRHSTDSDRHPKRLPTLWPSDIIILPVLMAWRCLALLHCPKHINHDIQLGYNHEAVNIYNKHIPLNWRQAWGLSI